MAQLAVAYSGMAEARFVQQQMTQEHGTPKANPDTYKKLTPFYSALAEPGNERHLKHTAVRVYHDVDINWYLHERRRSVLDENFAYSSELIKRLLLQGNQQAEFVQSDRKGYRSNGQRHPHAWSIINESECIQWIKSLSFATYTYSTPPDWRTERNNFPLDFAPQLPYTGLADLRFAPGWDQTGSDDFWSYTALWLLDKNPAITAATLKRDLEAYYTGLIRINVPNATLIPKPVVTINARTTASGNKPDFTGVIKLYDPFMTKGLIDLAFKAYVNDCPGQKKAVFFELSPQSQTKAIWQRLDAIQQHFSCVGTF